ncbi:hypothetical protein BDV96DRAFT_588001 [Lophiotrema nucula]|uniref:RRM domain-containing protein n=1 Tax=Lophiotrema nucula TaxID=690887 RepID=A0A6A5YP40_9PLEO|nr:hypothetical protein BDV96DRAFT_588001 [Lophiotrema nucula]
MPRRYASGAAALVPALRKFPAEQPAVQQPTFCPSIARILSMAPVRKKQRLSEDGTAAVTASEDTDPPTTALEVVPNDEEVRKKNLKQRRSLFVRSLAPTVTTEDLTEHFSQNYPIKHAVAVLDPTTKQCKGFGFVTFADAEDAQRAQEELEGSKIQGKKIRVEFAESRHRDVDSDIPGHKKSTPAPAAVEAKAKREQERKEQAPPKLIVRNLPWSIRTPEDLTKLFLSYGKIKTATLPKKPSGELKGFGFVLIRGKKNAERALAGVNGKEVDGRTLAVDWAVDKETWQNIQNTAQEDDDADMVDGVSEDEEDGDDLSSVVSESEEEESDSEADSEEDSNLEGSNTGYEDVSDDEEGGVDLDPEEEEAPRPKSNSYTLFVRNLPFSVDDESLYEHFTQFGRLRYARIVLDHDTERPKGTGFVAFVTEEDAVNCLKSVPRIKIQTKTTNKKDGTSFTTTHSLLEDPDADPTGKYTIDGRVLQLSLAVDRNEASRLTTEGQASRFNRDNDKRRLYLLAEGTIATNTPLYEKLSPSERAMREASAKQRQKLIQTNPALNLSFTRLSVRNIPRSITSKILKELARQAVVGFAKDVKEGKRQKLSKEELARGGDAMEMAEKIRKKRGKGIVKQAKVVFETEKGSKVTEGTGAGRSRGYGFIEYYTHRNALMGLRWLNGHAVDYRVKGDLPKGKKAAKEAMEDRKKRLIAEFAIENANVVSRRSDRETKAREPQKQHPNTPAGDAGTAAPPETGKGKGKKRKRDDSNTADRSVSGKKHGAGKDGSRASGADAGDDAVEKGKGKDEKVAQRERIIRKKRMARRARKGGKA